MEFSYFCNPNDDHLIEEQLAPLLFAQVHLLHGHLATWTRKPLNQLLAKIFGGCILTCRFVCGNAHSARGALAYFIEVVEILARISGGNDHLQGGTELFVGQALVLLWLTTRSACLLGSTAGSAARAGGP